MISESSSHRWAALALVTVTACSGVRYYSHPLDPTSSALARIDVRARPAASVSDVTLRIERVIPPNRVHAGAVAYYAWTRAPSAAAWTRLGLLGFNPSGHDATLSATAPGTRFEFLITLEDEFDPTEPSSVAFLSDQIGRPVQPETARSGIPGTAISSRR